MATSSRALPETAPLPEGPALPREAERSPEACPVSRAVRMIGGRWKLQLLWQLTRAPKRYGELRRALPGISERMLIEALRGLEADGLVARTQHPEVPPRVEYALTAKGRSLGPVLEGLLAWGLAHA